ncbi:hypothetical protein [Sphingobacterium lactis]|uniref:Uncharacterized protein n=1 Tax=Sphingobacterium lactis TaxID=797291 RepID=A0A1H6AB46_9SPHI|nr:hypothetical protein [Sphingobacterium lactis]SEG45267.1 hypothetical protein SAMN05421877_10834 [Sphingobacterium lactis]
MKVFSLLVLLMMVWCFSSSAQNKEKKSEKESTKAAKTPALRDSSIFPNYKDSLVIDIVPQKRKDVPFPNITGKNQDDGSIAIPNAGKKPLLQGQDDSVILRKDLPGDKSVPMKGTERLDRKQRGNAIDTLKTEKIIKK